MTVEKIKFHLKCPKVIALEAIDAAGKQTQAKMLADYIDASTVEGMCLRLSFPAYDTPVGKLIKSKLKGLWGAKVDDSKADFLEPYIDAHVLQALMISNRYELANQIDDYVHSTNGVVILDRYWASAVAYGSADGLDKDWLIEVHSRLPLAHHVLIDIPVEESFKRRPNRDDAYEADRGRLEKAREAYLRLFDNSEENNYCESWHIVDGLGTQGEVHERIKKVLGI